MNARTLLGLAALALPWLPSQSPVPVSEGPDAPVAEHAALQDELAQWRALHGPAWRAQYDPETGFARILWGGSAAASFLPREEQDWVRLALTALGRTSALHGVDLDTLVPDRVVFLPLGLAGSSDKWTVRLRQELRGVPVLGGSVNVLFDATGRLLSVDASALCGGLADFSTLPAVPAQDALERATGNFGSQTGLPPTRVVAPRLVVTQQVVGKHRRPRLAWEVEVHFESEGSAPEGWRYLVDALRGEVLQRKRAVHHFDVSGQVRSLATPGLAPDRAGNPPISQPMPHLRVESAQGNAVTDAAGNFTIPGASAPLSVTVVYEGLFAATSNQAGSDYSLSTSLPASSGNVVLMNPAGQPLVTAEANAFDWIGRMREWTRAVNPSDPTSDFLAPANVNISSTCNAYYNGVSVNFYQAGGSCPNTAYSTVVLHEMGHWLNDLYGSGNGSDGFGEGNADAFAMYVVDDPVVGHEFCGAGCDLRTGLNTRQFCGDCCGGCYGQVHTDGEVLMGALWKVRARLKTAIGTAAGSQAADTLFNAWMNAYDDTQIKSVIEIHWLTLDDDDGNIDNGTPNYAHIDGGFRDQGFPGFSLPFVAFANVTQLPDTTNEVGPYPVLADLVAQFNPPLVSPTLSWRSNGGAWNAIPLVALGGDQYQGDIPGQVAPAKVEYYLSAEDSLGNQNSYPEGAAAAPLRFLVGVQTVFFSEDFESGAAGWTHGQLSIQDDWQRSADVGLTGAGGKSGDPTTAWSGSNIWGNDLGASGWNGAYTNDVHNWLRSPPIDLTQALGSTLRFRRWLTVESGVFDRASVLVDGIEVWANPTTGDLIDTSWVETEIDISAVADGHPDVEIEFRLQSDGSVVFGGWNLDDVEILSLQPGCTAPTASSPAGQSACPGTSISFETAASGTAPLAYQWKKDGNPILGATSSLYSVTPVTSGDAGSYTVLVTNACGSVETSPAVLVVNVPVTVTPPPGATLCPGNPVSFATTAGGTGPFAYQWKKDGAPLGGATSSSYSIASVVAGDAGSYTVEVTGACGTVETSPAVLVVNAPATATPPSGATLCPGSPVSFATTAGGTGPFAYQWKKGGSPIPGATSSSYSIASVVAGDAGSYSVEVTGACGTVEPSPAVLVVNAPVTATPPSGATLCPGSPVSFATTAGGTGPFAYQWKKGGSPIPGATSSSYSIASVVAGDAGSYTVEVTGACGTVETSPAVLVVNAPMTATPPVGATVCVGNPVSFATTAGGTGPFAYQWKKDGAPLGGATSSSYSIASVVAGDAGSYTVEVTGACGTVETSPAVLVVNAPVTATPPVGATVCVGNPVSFATTAGGTGPFAYQWKKDGSPIAGATSSSYSIASVVAGDAGSYTVEVTGACGTLETSPAVLVVNAPVTATPPVGATVCVGNPVSFATTAGGTGPFAYQWKKDGSPIAGATSSSYSIASVVAGDAGSYTVEVTGACGTVETSAALLDVTGVSTVYCTAKLNSQGCLPAIAAAGVPSASAGSGYVISASLVRAGANGVFFYSTSGPAAVPFQGGFLCVGGTVRRTAGQNSGGTGPCGGNFAQDFNATIASGADPALVAGAQFWGQFWSRDPASPSATSLSDAVTAVICP